jgi:sortase A
MLSSSKKSGLIAALAIGLVAVGTWQTGQGIWIYAKARLAQCLLQRAWERTENGETQVKPWPWADTWPLVKLQVPQYDIDLIVLAGANGRTLAFGPAHVSSSATPGSPGMAIVTGHRDTHFQFLRLLKLGDVILVKRPGAGQYRYRVIARERVDGRTANIVATWDETALVLITCYPFDAIIPGGPLRYVVTAELITEHRTAEHYFHHDSMSSGHQDAAFAPVLKNDGIDDRTAIYAFPNVSDEKIIRDTFSHH